MTEDGEVGGRLQCILEDVVQAVAESEKVQFYITFVTYNYDILLMDSKY
jgi:hypothetical protein